MNVTALEAPIARGADRAWLFSRRTDLWAFGAPAVVALAIVAGARALGFEGDTPPGLWLLAVLGVDVAHVWSTIWRTYADPLEVRRRPELYIGAPLACYALGVALHVLGGSALFWRVLAYAAVFHFIRQQYGWVALHRRRAGEQDGRWIDTIAIYSSTLGPLVWWHASPARSFHWFIAGDFALGLPAWVGTMALGVEAAALLAYVVRAALQAVRGELPWGKHLVVASTAACWFIGIVAFDSDLIFTVTNVLIHGIPYFALIFRYGDARFRGQRGFASALFDFGWPAVYALLVVIALVEEGLWDGLVWHDHPQFFGAWSFSPGPLALALIVPLLAVPQATHYLLDAFIWRVGPKNPQLAERLRIGVPLA